jgi:hypothetical protein
MQEIPVDVSTGFVIIISTVFTNFTSFSKKKKNNFFGIQKTPFVL